jgi:hypothetical protein
MRCRTRARFLISRNIVSKNLLMVNFMAAMRFRIGLITVAFSLSALPAYACSCSGGNASSCLVPAADIIVRATVVSIEVNQTRPPFSRPAPDRGPQPLGRSPGAVPQPVPLGAKVTLSVSERFRGAAGATLVIRNAPGDCAYPFQVGHEYLVLANERQGEVTVSSCSATQPAKVAVARIEQLRALRDGTTLPDLYGFVGTHPLRSDEAGWEQVQPMPGLTVTARSNSAEYRTQTADDGLYRFRGLPAGPYRLGVAAPPGRLALWGGGAEYPITSRGISCAMNFEVFWDGRISGTIIGRDGQPPSGMITALYAGPEPAQPFGAQVKDGRFEILRLPPGRYRLMFLPTLANRRTGSAVYYPGTQAHDAATLIEVGEGAHVDGLMFTIF